MVSSPPLRSKTRFAPAPLAPAILYSCCGAGMVNTALCHAAPRRLFSVPGPPNREHGTAKESFAHQRPWLPWRVLTLRYAAEAIADFLLASRRGFGIVREFVTYGEPQHHTIIVITNLPLVVRCPTFVRIFKRR